MLDNGYGKIFKQIFAGTLRADWKALVTFEQLIVLSDCDGVVDLPHEVIHNITGIPLDIIQHGISVLEQPDPRSRSREFEGRRIERLDDHRDWGWRIVNHRYYRDLASRDDKRTADRVRVAEKRGRERSENTEKTSVSQPVAECRTSSRMSPTHTQTHTQLQEKDIPEKGIPASGDAVRADDAIASRNVALDNAAQEFHTKQQPQKPVTTTGDTSVIQGPAIITKRRRKLQGWRLIAFMRFWETFDFKQGRAEAADAWLDIAGLDDAMVDAIVFAASVEAGKRSEIVQRNGTPKWAQGWLTARRWEDEAYQPKQKVSVAAQPSMSERERSRREAIKYNAYLEGIGKAHLKIDVPMGD